MAHPYKKEYARLAKAITAAERGNPRLFTQLVSHLPHAPMTFVDGAGQHHTGQQCRACCSAKGVDVKGTW